MERVKREGFSISGDSTGYTISFRGVAIVGCGTIIKAKYRNPRTNANLFRETSEKELDKIIRICNGEHWDYYKQYYPYCRIATIIEDKDYNNK